MDVDDQYFWLWGGSESLQMSNNRDISQESQADGIAFEMLTTVYDMSSKQKEALWDRYFGRFDTTRDQLNEIKSIAESEYPDFAVSDLGDPLASIFNDYPNGTDASLLRKIAKRLSRIGPYIGYMNPMLPQDTHKLWDVVKN
jgi:predicted YcjX-like family ATPase